MPQHIVFVGPDLFSAYHDMVRGLKRVGVRVTGLGHTPRTQLDSELRWRLDDYVQVGNLLDAGALLRAVRAIAKHRAVDRIETGDESLVLAVAQVREALGLPGLSARSARLCRDKPAMKEALRVAGVPCAESAGVDNLNDLREFAERVGFPLILKPRSALGGLGTYRTDNVRELEAAARELKVDQGESAAVEEFVEGHEGFYDTLSIDGQVVHEFVSHYYPNVLEALDNRTAAPQIAATNRVAADSYDELKEMGRKVIEVLDLGTSATHMEWFFGPKGLKFSEIGARPPGERIWDLYCVGNDIDLWVEWAMVTVHGRPGDQASRRFATGSVQVRPDRDGKVVGYSGLAEVMKQCRPYIFQQHLPRHGEPTVPVYKGYYSNAWFRLRHPSYDELLRLMSFIGAELTLHAA